MSTNIYEMLRLAKQGNILSLCTRGHMEIAYNVTKSNDAHQFYREANIRQQNNFFFSEFIVTAWLLHRVCYTNATMRVSALSIAMWSICITIDRGVNKNSHYLVVGSSYLVENFIIKWTYTQHAARNTSMKKFTCHLIFCNDASQTSEMQSVDCSQ